MLLIKDILIFQFDFEVTSYVFGLFITYFSDISSIYPYVYVYRADDYQLLMQGIL
jgi:hypothetical protein